MMSLTPRSATLQSLFLIVILILTACNQESSAQFTLNITFSGLVAFVPQNGPDGKKWLWAILPAADDPMMSNVPVQSSSTSVFSKLYPLPVHQAFIKIPAKYLYSGTQCLDPAQCKQLGEAPVFFALRGKDALKPQLSKTDYIGHDIEISGLGDVGVDLTGLRAIPKLSAAHQNHEKVLGSCLVQPPSDETRKLVAARLLLKSGTLSPEMNVPHVSDIHFAFYDMGGTIHTCREFPMVCDPKATVRDIPQKVVFKVTYKSAPLKLTLKNFRDGQPQSFVLEPPSGENHVDIDIVNVPGDDVLNRMELTKMREDNVLEHFNLFYLISQGRVGPYLFPAELGKKGGQPYCAHVQLSPPS